MKTIQFAGKSLMLDPSGVLLWPERQIAVVADLHLEKATYFAQRGQLLPPQESCDTLLNLQSALDRVECSSLILLGDSFHDETGFQRLERDSRALWEQICEQYAVTFIVGNHDGAFVPPNTESADYLEVGGLVFRHQAEPGSVAEISGHYHPKASLKFRGNRITRPCFVTDGQRMILPAFGTLTGGLDVRSREISELFSPDCVVHFLGENKIYSVPVSKL